MSKSGIGEVLSQTARTTRSATPIGSAILLGLFVLTATATATSVQLAQTVPTDPNDGSWVFTNNAGVSGAFTTVSGGSPVTFDYTPGSIAGPLGNQLTGDLAAHVFLSATTSTPAATGFGGLLFDQPINSGTIQILLDTPINGHSDLLTVTFTNADIAGFSGTPAFSAQDGSGTTTLTYSSDFLNFGGTTTGNNFQTTMFANLSLGAGNFLSDFAANGISTFGFDNANLSVNAVPEPSSIVLLCLGAITSTAVARRRVRKRTA